MNNSYQYERLFRALGDSHRLIILGEISAREMNAGEILETVDVVQSTLSHHMKTLCESGLVIPRKQGKWTNYTIDPDALKAVIEYLERLAETVGKNFGAGSAKKETENKTSEAADKTMVKSESPDPAAAETPSESESPVLAAAETPSESENSAPAAARSESPASDTEKIIPESAASSAVRRIDPEKPENAAGSMQKKMPASGTDAGGPEEDLPEKDSFGADVLSTAMKRENTGDGKREKEPDDIFASGKSPAEKSSSQGQKKDPLKSKQKDKEKVKEKDKGKDKEKAKSRERQGKGKTPDKQKEKSKDKNRSKNKEKGKSKKLKV